MNDINDPQDFHDDDTESFVSWPGETETPQRPSATEALAEAALDAALTADIAAILNTRGFTLVLRVPGDDWISPVKAAVASLCPDAVRITGRERYNASSDDEVCAALARGREIVGIAGDPQKLPGALTRTADASLVLGLPIGEKLRTVIADVTGAACPPVAPDLGAGLSLAEAASAIRPNDEPRVSIARLERAQASVGGLDVLADAPSLGSLHGYGVVMAWALDLTSDVEAYVPARSSGPESAVRPCSHPNPASARRPSPARSPRQSAHRWSPPPSRSGSSAEMDISEMS